jgi:hypothetical protein
MVKKERKNERKKETRKEGKIEEGRTSREGVAAMEVEELQESRRKNEGRISGQQEGGN